MKRVFVVEDEAVVALEIKDHLRALGYEVCGHVARGEAALQQIPELRPDLVLIDINLGKGISGLDVAERLRGVVDVPVIILTAYADEELTRRAALTRSFAYLSKPFEPRVLGANIELALVRHEAAVALRESEARFRALFEQAGVGVAEIDTVGWRFIRVNRRCAEIVGYGVEELLAVGIAALVHPDDLAADFVRRDRLLSGELREYTRERRFIRKDGSTVWVELSVTPLWVPGEAPDRHMVILTDTTERRLAEEELQRSERQLSEAQRLAKLGSWQWDLAEHTARWSEQLYEMCGVEPALGGTAALAALTLLLHPDDRERVTGVMQDALRTQQPFEIQCRLVRPDGGVRHFEVRAVVVVDHEGRPVLVRGTAQDVTERALTAAALEESERRYRRIFTDAIEGIFEVKLDGTIVDVNPAYAQMLGYESAAELIGMNQGDLYADPGARRRIQQTHRRSDIIVGVEATWKKKDGELLSVELYANTVRDKDGKRIGHHGIVRDVTSQRQLAAAMHVLSTGLSHLTGHSFFEAVARKVAAVAGAEIGFVGVLRPGPDPAIRMLGLVVDGAARRSGEHTLAGTPCEFVISGGTSVIMEDVQARFPSDAQLVKLGVQGFVASPLVAAAGQVIGLVGIMTRRPFVHPERKESLVKLFALRTAAELERQGAETRFVGVFEHAPDAILIVDEAGRILQANRVAEQTFGYSRNELLRLTVEELMPEDQRHRHVNLRASFIAHDQLRRMGSVRSRLAALHKDGTGLPVEISLSAMHSEDGTFIVAVVRDVTQRLALEQLAHRQQRLDAIGTLAGGIAHDLNNALGPILMAADILRSQYPGAPDMLETIEVSARRAAGMARQLLTFAKGAEGERVAVQLGHLVGEMERIIISTFPKNIQLQVRLDRAVPPVRGDATALHQVLLNLCVNARDAMPSGGQLTLELGTEIVDAATPAGPFGEDATLPGKYVVLRVLDDGSGMSTAVLDQIFDPFFTTKDPDRGTGLGLATVLNVVRGHGGFVRVKSELSRGSTFAVYLPADAAVAEAPTAPAERQTFRGHGEMVLFVDDEAVLRDVAAQVLTELGFMPLTAVDGTDGLLQVAQRSAEIRGIITDLAMPHMDGIAFIRAVRRFLPAVPIIGASGRVELAAEKELRALGVHILIDKPFTRRQLADALQRALAGGEAKT